MVTCPVWDSPARAAAGVRSKCLPLTHGPRSLIRTVTHPLWQTRTCVPNGNVRCAAVTAEHGSGSMPGRYSLILSDLHRLLLAGREAISRTSAMSAPPTRFPPRPLKWLTPRACSRPIAPTTAHAGDPCPKRADALHIASTLSNTRGQNL